MIQRGKGRWRGKDGADPEDAKRAGPTIIEAAGSRGCPGAAQSPGKGISYKLQTGS